MNSSEHLINNISKEGDIVLNKDSEFFDFLSNKAKKYGIKVTSFSLKKRSDISLLGIKKIKNKFRLKVNVKGKIFYFYTKNSTENFICNVLACISTLSILGSAATV